MHGEDMGSLCATCLVTKETSNFRSQTFPTFYISILYVPFLFSNRCVQPKLVLKITFYLQWVHKGTEIEEMLSNKPSSSFSKGLCIQYWPRYNNIRLGYQNTQHAASTHYSEGLLSRRVIIPYTKKKQNSQILPKGCY